MAEHTRRKLYYRFHIIAVLPYIWNERSLPLRTVDMRALALDLTVRATGHLYPLRALSGRLQRGWCCSFFVFDFVALLGTIYPAILRHFHSVVARSFFQQPLSAVSQLSSHCGQRLVVSYWYQRLSSCSRLVSYYHRRLSSCCEGLGVGSQLFDHRIFTFFWKTLSRSFRHKSWTGARLI